jgi:hypothetical protein
MQDDESISFIKDKEKLEHKWKELLYNLFYEIKSEILGKKIEIEEEEYQENIRNIKIPKLIQYIHDSIQILVTVKIDKIKSEQKIQNKQYISDNKKVSHNTPRTQLGHNEKKKYENIIRKLEEKERFLIKKVFQSYLQKETFQNKIDQLREVEEEYEEMKAKLKYENGRFLNNDRKDNEILILRNENSRLKNVIDELEIQNQNLDKLNKEQKEKINSLNEDIKNLNSKIEEKQAELNISQNYLSNLTSLNNSIKINKIDLHKCFLEYEDNNNMTDRITINNNLASDREKSEHNNTVKYFKHQNINIRPGTFNKLKKKIYSYKKKMEGNKTNNNEKKSTKENTNTNNNDITTKNDYTERIKPKLNKYFPGNNIKKIINNSSNKKKYCFQNNNSHISSYKYSKYSYLFHNKNNLNNISSVKKIITYGTIKRHRPNSTNKPINKNKVVKYRSSSGE